MRRGHYYSDEMRIAYAAKFAEELAEILYEVAITHRELSLQLGVAHATVDSWTRVVNPKVPNEHNILRLGEFLDKLKPGAASRIRIAAGQRALIDGQAVTSPPQTIATLGEVPIENDAGVEVEGETPLPPAMITVYPSNLLPSLTQFVGRTEEIIEVRRLLEKSRLLSLVGTGGIGKTRLALEVAHGLDGYPDGVWLVELGALLDPELIAATIAQVLPTVQHPEALSGESLAAEVGDKRLLLILDNCEHLVAACAQLSEMLLQKCPNIDILATSREILGCPGEMVWRTHALSIPQSQDRLQSGDYFPTTDGLRAAVAESESGKLFLARARERHASFELTSQNAPYVVKICNQLEGIPLALELAAARISAMSIEEIAQRLDSCMQLLTHSRRTRLPRQQALRTSLQWSHDLLTPEEQALFRRLSLFVGGWTLEGAEGVCAGEGISFNEVFNNLTQLVDKSLVIAERLELAVGTRAGETRYRFLETIRQYALQQLAGSIDAEIFSRRHAQFFAAMVERSGKAQIVSEIDNVRAALAWTTSEPRLLPAAYDNRISMDKSDRTDSLSQENERARRVGRADRVIDHERTNLGLYMVGALRAFWQSRGETVEGIKWTEKALAQSDSTQRTAARAHALMTVITLKQMGEQHTGMEELSAENESIWREIGDRSGLAQALAAKGVRYLNSRRLEAGRTALRESQALAEEVGDSSALSFILFLWGSQELEVGDVEVAYTCLQRSLVISRTNGDMVFAGAPLVSLARAAWLKGNYELAQQMVEEALADSEVSGNNWRIAMSQNSLADIVRCQGDYARAAMLSNKSLTTFRKLGDRPNMVWALYTCGHAAKQSGDYLQAIECWTESLSIAVDLGKNRDVVLCLAALAGAYCSDGQLSRSATLFGVVDALRVRMDVRWSPYDEETYERQRAETQAALSEERFKLDWETGGTMQEAEAAAFALNAI